MDLAEQLVAAAEAGDEAAVQQLLAAGARADQADPFGRLPLHCASYYGHEGVVRILLETAPAIALRATCVGWTPLHSAVCRGNLAVIKLLLEAAPEVAYVPYGIGKTPLHLALRNESGKPAQEVQETACYLVRAAPAVQPALQNLIQFSQRSATLFADLVARLPLSQEQWQSIPAPCPDLARALPAVLQRSAAEAGWLVGRLAEEQRARLQAAALSLARAQLESNAVLPAELNGRILLLCLLD